MLPFFFNYSTENQEKDNKPKEEETKETVTEEKPKIRSSQQKDEAPAFTSSVFALLDVYLNKILVSPRVPINSFVLKSTRILCQKLLHTSVQKGAVLHQSFKNKKKLSSASKCHTTKSETGLLLNNSSSRAGWLISRRYHGDVSIFRTLTT